MALSHALRPSRTTFLIVLAFLAASFLAAALVLFAASVPGLSLLLIAGAAAVSAGLLLIDRPTLSLHGWLVLLVMPPALQLEPFHTLATNGACLAALASWLLADGLRRDPMAWNGTLLLLGLCILWAFISLLWAPDLVEALPDGQLAYSTGPVHVKGKLVARFASTWRKDPDGRWRVVFDNGSDVCDCKGSA